VDLLPAVTLDVANRRFQMMKLLKDARMFDTAWLATCLLYVLNEQAVPSPMAKVCVPTSHVSISPSNPVLCCQAIMEFVNSIDIDDEKLCHHFASTATNIWRCGDLRGFLLYIGRHAPRHISSDRVEAVLGFVSRIVVNATENDKRCLSLCVTKNMAKVISVTSPRLTFFFVCCIYQVVSTGLRDWAVNAKNYGSYANAAKLAEGIAEAITAAIGFEHLDWNFTPSNIKENCQVMCPAATRWIVNGKAIIFYGSGVCVSVCGAEWCVCLCHSQRRKRRARARTRPQRGRCTLATFSSTTGICRRRWCRAPTSRRI